MAICQHHIVNNLSFSYCFGRSLWCTLKFCYKPMSDFGFSFLSSSHFHHNFLFRIFVCSYMFNLSHELSREDYYAGIFDQNYVKFIDLERIYHLYNIKSSHLDIWNNFFSLLKFKLHEDWFLSVFLPLYLDLVYSLTHIVSKCFLNEFKFI